MKTSLTLVCLVLLLVGCEKVIDLDLPASNPRLVVEGNILVGLDTLINVQTIKLSTTAPYIGNTLPTPVVNASVSVLEGSTTYTFTHTRNGIYTSTFSAQVGKTYQLRVTHAGDTYEAAETVPGGPAIESLGIKYFPSALGSPEGDFIVINTDDPAENRNFYFWRLFINGTLMINPSPGNIYRAIQQDEFFNGQPLVNYLPYDNFRVVKGDRAVMEQLNISEPMFNYLYALFNLTAASPVSGDVPPGNIRGNVINRSNRQRDALGYFGAASVSIKTKIVE
ncbi:MAG: DUF4249 domain-containing protein [Cyclobacteriaceae bacterium]|jgi:hypothetical protein